MSSEIECRIELTHTDFVMANHHVHGVPVLPGVTFLDIVYRVLLARGFDAGRVELRNVLFAEPVTTADGLVRELRVTVGAEQPTVRPVRIHGRWLRDGVAVGDWREHARADLVDTGEATPARDVTGLIAIAGARDDLDLLYARTRREGIRHGPPMTCSGVLHRPEATAPAPRWLVAELHADRSTAGLQDAFHLHPAIMDASTLAAFGQNEDVGAEPFIPFFIERFRAPAPLRGTIYAYVAAPEVVVGSGDLVRNSYTLHAADGSVLAEFVGMSCKRVRHRKLITDLRTEPEPAGDSEQRATVVHYLRTRIGEVLGQDGATLPTGTGFYDLGLDSVALLNLSGELEQLVGEPLYPTLLFEHSDIDSLASHLTANYRIRNAAGPAGAGPAGGPGLVPTNPAAGDGPAAEPVVMEPDWVPAPAVAGPPPAVVVAVDVPPETVAALRRTTRVIAVDTGGPLADPDAVLAARDRLTDAAAEAAAAAGPVAFLLCPAAGDPAPAAAPDAPARLWALVSAVLAARPTRPIAILCVAPAPATPELAALGALAATVTAEIPALRCRLLELAEPFDAGTLLAEAGDRATEPIVRWHGGVRQVRRWRSVAPDPGDGGGAGFRRGGAYLITGGGGGIGGLLAERLVAEYGASVLLVGRRPADAALQARITDWRNRGSAADYLQADITDPAEVRAAVAIAQGTFGRLDGVLHCAGTLHDGLFFRQQPAELAATWAAKVAGTVHLDEATRDLPLDFFAMFSSLAAASPNPGQAGYAYGNAFQAEYARWRAGRPDRPGRSVAPLWPLWADGGMRIPEPVLARSRAASGAAPLPTGAAMRLLDAALAGGPATPAVLYGDPARVPTLLAAPPPPAPPLPAQPLPAPPLAAQPAVEPPVATGDDPPAVAVIGLAGRYPGAADLAEFWRNLAEGMDCITEVPADRWDHAAVFDPNREAAGRTYSRWGGFLDGFDQFDPAFFGISRREAQRMDPQERLFLQVAWHTVEDAGYRVEALAAEPVGVYVGVMWNHYQLYGDAGDGVAPTAMHAAIANRVSYCLNLHGPSMAVDTACSSSLTALHLAVESLRRGECGYALAGGVNLNLHPQKYLQLAQGQFLSSDGRCRSFGAGGSGYVPGEGVGAVLLKRLDRALADGDHVYGVIRASVLNHTGRTGGFTVPSPGAQGRLVRAALARAGWDAGTVGYLEAHGTGTSLGDPIEIEGLREAFAGSGAGAGGCAVGSVKSNIGHLESAAGIAGLTKVLLQLQHRELVPSLHSAELNPQLALAGSPFVIQQVRQEWRPPAPGVPRRAGISAFGAGGANAHVLVEEAPPVPAGTSGGGDRLFVLSARTGSALRAYAGRYAELVDGWLASAQPAAAAAGRVADLIGLAAAALGIPASAISETDSLLDLGLDAQGVAELVRRAGAAWDAVPLDADLTIRELAALAGAAIPASPGAEPDRLLATLTYGLQVGRMPMAARLAVVAGSLEELRDHLRGFLAGDPPPAGRVWHGPATTRFGGPEERLAALRAGRLAEVAQDWVAGGAVPFEDYYAGRERPRRRPLPGYPFEPERCWIGQGRPGDRPPPPPPGAAPPPPPLAPVRFESTDEVRLRVLDGGVALVSMADRANHNMFTPALMSGLENAFAHIAGREDITAVVVTGQDNVFSMGATPEALADLAGGRSRFTDRPFVYEGLLRCDKPVIAAIQGHASGGGLAFGLYADVVVMSRESSYSANFMRYGFTPGMGATYILERRLGRALAAELFYTGRAVTGAELERRGADLRFAPSAEVLPTALELAASMARTAPAAVRALKRDLAGRVLAELPAAIEREAAMHERVIGADAVARIREHFSKVDAFSGGPGERAVAAAVPESTPDGPAREDVEAVLVDVLCASLYLEPAEIDPARTFSELGLDSIGAVEVVRELNRAFNLDVDSVAVYDHPTVPQLAAHVQAVAGSRAALRREAAAETAPPPAEPAALPLEPLAPQPVPAEAALPLEPLAPPVPAEAALPLEPLAPPVPAEAAQPASSPRVVLAAVEPASPNGHTRATVTLPALPGRDGVPAEPAPSRPSVPPSPPPAGDVPIAVIGMAGRFPDAPDLAAFWRNLAAGHDSIRTVPADRWDVTAAFDPDRRVPGRTYSRWAAMLSDVDSFDAGFFRISPLEAAAMDPQQRLFLEVAWSGIEDAGYADPAAGPRRWGVFVGCASGEYVDVLRTESDGESAHAFLGNSGSVLAARIGYLLDLTGPTMAVDTACSSSLVAVHLACQSIRSGDCDAAVAGGVALMLTPRMHVMTSKTGMLSPTGRSAPFASSADGIVLGEGAGVVVLKRLDRALADRDQVHGVILGSGINGDGRTNGLTAPSATSQAALIRRVHAEAGVPPAEVDYVETHGTGTPLGDPIEVKALDQVLGPAVAQRGPGFCGFGSVKSNIGHTTMAAGVAGLLKALLAIRHRQLPPTLHLDEVNQHIDLSGSALRPVTALTGWQAGPTGRRVAAVSSFGFSGTNAHLVVAEPPPRAPQPDGAADYPVVLSAPNPPALARAMRRLADRLQDPADRPPLVDVAYTLALGRAAFPVRAGTVVGDHDELVGWLRREANAVASADTGTAVDEGPAAAAGDPAGAVAAFVAGHVVDWSAVPALNGGRRVSLPTYPFATERHGVSAGRHRPAEPVPAPSAGAGGWLFTEHRVGGTPLLPGVAMLELAAGAAIADRTGQATGEPPAGGALTGPLRIGSVQWLRPFLPGPGRTPALRLTTSGGELRFTLTAAGQDGPAYGRGRILPDPSARIESEVVDLAAVRARCQASIGGADLYAGFAAAGIEYGPSYQVLDEVWHGDDEALGRLTVPPARATELADRPLHPVLMDGALQAVAALATGDAPLIPFALAELDVLAPVPAAGYSYVTRSGADFTVKLTDLDGRVCVRFSGLSLRSTRTDPAPALAATPAIFVPVLRDAAPVTAGSGRPAGRAVVVHGDGEAALAAALVAAHRRAGDHATAISWTEADDPGWHERAGEPDTVYLLATGAAAGAAEPSAARAEAVTLAGFRAMRGLARSPWARRALTVKVVVAGAAVPAPATDRWPAAAGLLGLARSAAAEHPQWRVGCVDVGASARAADLDRLAVALREEPADQPLVWLVDGRRRHRVLVPAGPADGVPTAGGTGPFRDRGGYLILGGAGGIGSALARHLASVHRARLTLVGRRRIDERIEALLAELRQAGGEAVYLPADIADPDAMRGAVARARASGELHGAFHSALVLRDRTLARMSADELTGALAPKLAGAVALGAALHGVPLDFLAMFSSAISFTAAPGQGNYAAASTFEDAYAAWLGRTAGFPVTVVNWGFWGTVGAVAQDRYAELFHRIGVGSIPPREGIAALTEVLRRRLPQAVVVAATPDGLARLGVDATTAGAAPDEDPAIAQDRRSFPLVERFAPALLRRRLAEGGVLPAGQPVTVAQLRDRLRVAADHDRLFDALVDMLVETGELVRAGEVLADPPEPAPAGAGDPDQVVRQHPGLAPHVALLTRCVDALPEVLAGRRRPTEVLFPNGSAELVERVYHGSAAADFHHRLLAGEAVAAIRRAHRDGEPVRLLEVGAGTGASSGFVLAACAESGIPVEYTYTDISVAFVNRGSDAFAARYPFTRFAVLDIEQDPAGQGFEPGRYDIVLATNVLHATARIDHTLAQVRRLLRPAGVVLINEVTARSHFLTATFGLTPGWWRFTDPAARLPHAPLLSPEQWWRALAAAGFEAPRTVGFPDVEPRRLGQCVLVATAAGTGSAPALAASPGAGPGPSIDPAAARDYVRRVFAEVLRFQPGDLADRVTFDNYGVDSLVSLDILARFEVDLGPLPATLLFEQLTIAQLAEHFAAEHADRLAAVLPGRPAGSAAATALDRPRAIAVRPAPVDAREADIAVIGVVGRYPGAEDLEQFWRLLAGGGSGITEVPPDRWDWREHFDPRPGTPQHSYGRWGGFLDGIDRFDPGFFGILPRAAGDIDPQERLFLETAYRLLEQAGYLGTQTHEPDTGVFAGTMYGSYGQLAAARWPQGELSGAHSAYWSIANRVSYVLDLRGPSFAVDSACSSSLLAVHLAAESIRRGECRMAIAGGVNLILHPAHLVSLSALNMLSADGRCKVFDAAADGFAPGEGVGAVLLKRVTEAVADGDRIWAVIRAGSANAGGKTSGYTVPNPNAQADLIAAAIRRAGLDPATIGYVEAHGTGTELGDPIELAGLQRAFGEAAGACAIGSVKANIGHLEGAAGIAGLTKVLLQLRHGRIAPCANLETTNPKITLDPVRYHLPRTLAEWPVPSVAGEPVPRRAGVSSFGAGGANVHLIVEEYPARQRPPEPAEVGPAGRLFVLSARSPEQLTRYAAEVADFLDRAGTGQPDQPPPALAELCCAAQLGRWELPERLAVAADDLPELARGLRDFAAGTAGPRLRVGTAKAVAGRRTGAPAAVDRPMRPADDLLAVAEHWVRGGEVDWRSWWPATLPARAPFPGCPWDRRRFWLSEPESKPAPESESAPESEPAPDSKPAPATLEGTCVFRRPVWQAAPLPDVDTRVPDRVLLVTGEPELAQALVAELGDRTRCLIAAPVAGARTGRSGRDAYRFDPRSGCAELVELLDVDGTLPDAVLLVVPAATAELPGPVELTTEIAAQLSHGFYPFVELLSALLATGRDGGRLHAVVAVTAPSGETDPAEPASGAVTLGAAAVAGALRAACREHSRLTGSAVTLPAGPAQRRVRLLATELCAGPAVAGESLAPGPAAATEISYAGGTRLARVLADYHPPALAGAPARLGRPGGTYLVTGGAGALGLIVAELLADSGASRLVLAGRSTPGSAAAARIEALRRTGTAVEFRRADVTRYDEVVALVRDCGPLHGVVHAAGITRDRRLVQKSRAELAEVIGPKVDGAVHLDHATRDQPLEFFVLFSSLAAETGNAGQADYCAANAVLNAFAAWREARRRAGARAGASRAIGWPLWADGGMAVDDPTRRLFERVFSMVPMATATGRSVLARGLAGEEPSFVAWETPASPAAERPVPAKPEPVPAEPVPAEPSASDLHALVEGWLRGAAARFLLVDEAEVGMDDDLLETGFDSITLTELINQVNEAFDLDLLPTVLFECATLAAFAAQLAGEHPAAIARNIAAVPPVPPAPPVAPAKPAPAAEPELSTVALAAGAGPVAIVGMAGTLPGAPDLDTFWERLVAGDDLTGPAPADRLELHAHPETAGVRGGFVDGLASFDASLFRISRTEASLMDPQQRLFLETAWRVIEDAGYRPQDLAGTDTGLFVGVSTIDYGDLLRQHAGATEAHAASGIAHSILANRVSHALDLRGPSEAIDTACSSSLVALHRAVRAIAAGDCAAAIVGGVNALLSPGLFISFDRSGMLSSDGACKTFDAGADGYVRGEGAGAILLKPLAAARAAGDHVYAVIRGVAVNHGGRSSSLTAPNPEAQARVLVQAYREAGVDPDTVTAIEAHGTGTRLGDPVEVEGLKKAFTQLYADRGAPVPDRPRIGIGSVKTNIGHLEAAAGIAGVLKVLLAMRHGVLPASIHLRSLNPYLRLDGTPFFVNTAARTWEPVDDAGQPVRRAGVSSFGFGGVNAHVVLEAVASPPAAGPPPGECILPLSAPDEAALAGYAGRLARRLAGLAEQELAGVAYTLQTGRTPRGRRLVIRAAGVAEAVRALSAAHAGRTDPALLRTPDREPAGSPVAAWLAGEDVPWARLWRGPVPRRVPLPPAPLSRATYWFDDRAAGQGKEPIVSQPDIPAALEEPSEPERPARRKLRLAAPQRRDQPATAPVPPPATTADPPAGGDGDRVGYLREQIADITGADLAEVDLDASFSDLGLDSIFRMDLARRVNVRFGTELDAAALYDHDTVALLASHLAAGAGPSEQPAPAAAAVVSAGPAAMGERPPPAERFVALVRAVLDRPFDPARTFADNGFTSFDMLRVIGALERSFGALRKTLLFDAPTPADVVAELAVGRDGQVAELLDRAVAAAEPGAGGPIQLVPADQADLAPPAVASGSDDGPVVVRKRALEAHPELAARLREIDARHGKEGGLAGRDIAPLVFLGARRQAYFHVSRRDEHLFAWSYAGSEEDFPGLAGELLSYAARHRLRANFLSLLPLREAGGRPLTATPFGAVQRIEDLASFTIAGGKMTRLRYQIRRFTKAGACRTEEYRPGTEPHIDAQIVEMIDQWGDRKQMVNPYVGVVRDELRRGELAARHRLFITWLDDRPANVVIITEVPSERGYLLDLEFYPKSMPSGGLEFAIVSIVEKLRDEGCTLFSFGASFGVKICESDNPAPEVELGLSELRSANVFGPGNFQFKNKFRPVNRAIYLCQPADEERTGVTDVILMIANPDLGATVPEMLSAAPSTPSESVAGPEPRLVPPPVTGHTARADQLARCGWNPLALAHAEVEVDLVTDSWAELAGPAIDAHVAELAGRVAGPGQPVDFAAADWLPFDAVVPTWSGRRAEALLCRAWPGQRGTVIHSGVFPTWLVNLAGAGFTTAQTPTVTGTGLFQGDLDLGELRSRLAAGNGGTSFVVVELSGNAGGGYPISVANLRAVREIAGVHRVPVVLDATRLLENAVFVARHEPELAGADQWTAARELLSLADAATLSLSKDYGLTFGGLVATRLPALADRLRDDLALHGREVGLHPRRQLAAALADRDRAGELVRTRMAAVEALWSCLSEAGLPVAAPAAGHAVLLDVGRMPRFAELDQPVASFLAWLYRETGVRGGPHLAGWSSAGPAPRQVRLAVPVGLPVEVVRAAGERIAARWRDPDPVPDLLPVEPAHGSPAPPYARYHPAATLPADISAAMREGYLPRDENVSVLLEHAGVSGQRLSRADGQVEFFLAGEGPVLVLMHPFNIGAGIFARQFARLAERFRLLAVHHPGVGATSWRGDLTLPGIAGLYADVLGELGMTGPVHVAGASFGGLVAQSFALRYPDRTASLTLLGSSFKVGNRNGEVNRLSLVAAEDFDRLVAQPDGQRIARERAELEALLLRCESMDPQTGLKYLDVFASQPSLLSRLPEITAPTMVVQGAHDTVIPRKTAHLLHGAIPNATYVEVPGGGHFLTLTHADEVHAALVPFLTAQAPAGDRPAPAPAAGRSW